MEVPEVSLPFLTIQGGTRVIEPQPWEEELTNLVMRCVQLLQHNHGMCGEPFTSVLYGNREGGGTPGAWLVG